MSSLFSNDLIDLGEACVPCVCVCVCVCECVCVTSFNHSHSKTHTDSHQQIPIKAISDNYLKMQLREVAPHPQKSQSRVRGKKQRSCASQDGPHDL